MLKRFQAGDGSGKAEDTRLHPVQTPADGVDVPLNRSKLPPDFGQLIPELGVFRPAPESPSRVRGRAPV